MLYECMLTIDEHSSQWLSGSIWTFWTFE